MEKQQESRAQEIKKTSQEDTSGQLRINRETTIDFGADFDYVNEEWSQKQGFAIKDVGKGRVKGFDGKTD